MSIWRLEKWVGHQKIKIKSSTVSTIRSKCNQARYGFEWGSCDFEKVLSWLSYLVKVQGIRLWFGEG